MVLHEGVDPYDELLLSVLDKNQSGEGEVHDAVDYVLGSPGQWAYLYRGIRVWDQRADVAEAYLPCPQP